MKTIIAAYFGTLLAIATLFAYDWLEDKYRKFKERRRLLKWQG